MSLMVQFPDYMHYVKSNSAQIKIGRGIFELLKETGRTSFATDELYDVAIKNKMECTPKKAVDTLTTYYRGTFLFDKKDWLWHLAEGFKLDDFEVSIKILESKASKSTERL